MAFLTSCIKGGSDDQRPGWLLQFQYDKNVVEALKAAVPHTEREWRPEALTWWVSEEHADAMKQLFTNFEALAFLQGRLF